MINNILLDIKNKINKILYNKMNLQMMLIFVLKIINKRK